MNLSFLRVWSKGCWNYIELPAQIVHEWARLMQILVRVYDMNMCDDVRKDEVLGLIMGACKLCTRIQLIEKMNVHLKHLPY